MASALVKTDYRVKRLQVPVFPGRMLAGPEGKRLKWRLRLKLAEMFVSGPLQEKLNRSSLEARVNARCIILRKNFHKKDLQRWCQRERTGKLKLLSHAGPHGSGHCSFSSSCLLLLSEFFLARYSKSTAWCSLHQRAYEMVDFFGKLLFIC